MGINEIPPGYTAVNAEVEFYITHDDTSKLDISLLSVDDSFELVDGEGTGSNFGECDYDMTKIFDAGLYTFEGHDNPFDDSEGYKPMDNRTFNSFMQNYNLWNSTFALDIYSSGCYGKLHKWELKLQVCKTSLGRVKRVPTSYLQKYGLSN